MCGLRGFLIPIDWLYKRVGNLIVRNRGRHAVDKITCHEKHITSEEKRNIMVKKGTGSPSANSFF